MFEDVPDPVWKTSIGNWSSSSPWAMRSPAAAIRSALPASRSPNSAFTRAAAALIRPSQRATGIGIGSPEIGKLPIALLVSAPQSSLRTLVSLTETSLALGSRLPGVAAERDHRAGSGLPLESGATRRTHADLPPAR